MDKLVIQRKTPFSESITFEYEDGTPYNLTGIVVLFTVKEVDDTADNDDAALIKHSISEHTSPLTGTTVLALTEAQNTIPAKCYKYDFRGMDGETVIFQTLTDYVYFLNIVTHRKS